MHTLSVAMEPKRVTIVAKNLELNEENEYLYFMSVALKQNGYNVKFIVKHFDPKHTFNGLDVNSVRVIRIGWMPFFTANRDLMVSESDIYIVDGMPWIVELLKSRRKTVVYVQTCKRKKILSDKQRIAQTSADVVLSKNQTALFLLGSMFGFKRMKYLPPCIYHFGEMMNKEEYKFEEKEFLRMIRYMSGCRMYLLFLDDPEQQTSVENILKAMSDEKNLLGDSYNDKLIIMHNEPNEDEAIRYCEYLEKQFRNIMHKNVYITYPTDFSEYVLYAYTHSVFFLPNQDIKVAIKALYLKRILITFETSEITEEQHYYKEFLVPSDEAISATVRNIFETIRVDDMTPYMERSYRVYENLFSSKQFYSRLLDYVAHTEPTACPPEILSPTLPISPLNPRKDSEIYPFRQMELLTEQLPSMKEKLFPLELMRQPNQVKQHRIEGTRTRPIVRVQREDRNHAGFQLPFNQQKTLNNQTLIETPSYVEINNIILNTVNTSTLNQVDESTPKKIIWTVKIDAVMEDSAATDETTEIRYEPVLQEARSRIHTSSILAGGRSGSHRYAPTDEASRTDPTITASPGSIASRRTAHLQGEVRWGPNLYTHPQQAAGSIAPVTSDKLGNILDKYFRVSRAGHVEAEEARSRMTAGEEVARASPTPLQRATSCEGTEAKQTVPTDATERAETQDIGDRRATERVEEIVMEENWLLGQQNPHHLQKSNEKNLLTYCAE